MSLGLVAYGASDDSDESETEMEATSSKTETQKSGIDVTGHISDEDEFETVSSTSASSATQQTVLLTSAAPLSIKLNASNSANTFSSSPFVSESHDNTVNSTSLTSLDDLPAPHALSSGLNNETVEEELEDAVKPKAAEIASAPHPPTTKKKQPVRITIPSLRETPLEEETGTSKNLAPSMQKSGLFSLLPAPMHSAKKEINRPLIPYSLNKKPVVAKSDDTKPSVASISAPSSVGTSHSADISSKRMTPFNALTGFDSDSDEDDDFKGSSTNFFSLHSSSEASDNTKTVSTQERLQSEEVSSSESDLNPQAKDNVSESAVGAEEAVDEGQPTPEQPVQGPEPGAVNDAPLNFRSVNRLNSWSGSSYGFLGPVGLSGPIATPSSFSSYETVPSNSQYNLANAEGPDEMGDADQEMVTDDDLKKFMSDKEFQKLQGKRKRGLEEAINFVDANVDDYVDPSEVSKHLTEETEYVSHKSKDNLPTAQQRRKKQITYLAYQAKERELELKNAWAQNRLTKKQTQSKYGF
ncbi:unnamed protein product [Lymnaea stagnalis]|uniref:Proline-rich protein PRCC n=1 Tax=Lymnaea stagnalis TaxID=6523 RepID=A0AAV2HJL1_LYMST